MDVKKFHKFEADLILNEFSKFIFKFAEIGLNFELR